MLKVPKEMSANVEKNVIECFWHPVIPVSTISNFAPLKKGPAGAHVF